MAQGGWNLDIETRCMQEVVDAGEGRILQQQKRKKWWRGQWGKSTYEAKWMQEIETHLGGRESSILKQDERKKLLRDMPPPTFRPPSQVLESNHMICSPSPNLIRTLTKQRKVSPLEMRRELRGREHKRGSWGYLVELPMKVLWWVRDLIPT